MTHHLDVQRSDGDCEQQEEETLALQAILAEAFTSSGPGRAEVCIPSADAPNKITVSIYLPDKYPSSAAPVLELHGESMSSEQQAEAIQQLHDLFHPGTVVLYEFLTWLQEREHYWKAAEPPPQQHEPDLPREVAKEHEPEAYQDSYAARPTDTECDHMWSIIKSGSPLTEKKSVFQAHLAPVGSMEDIEMVMATLLTNSKIQRATHNIMAYRIAVPDRGTYLQDCDDDGESAAGGRLLKLLTLVGAENVVVVVSRWFGGVLLGPSRFTHINNAARQLLDECGYVSTKQTKGSKKK